MVGFGRSGGGGGSVAALGSPEGDVTGLRTLFRRVAEDKKRQEALQELIERVEKLDRQMAALQLDWENAYDRLHQLMGRVSKRAEIARKAEEMHNAAEDQGQLHNGDVEIAGNSAIFLTPRQKQLQVSILRSRNRKVG